MKKFVPLIILTLPLLLGVVLITRPDIVSFGASPTQSVIVRETSTGKPLPMSLIELYAKAPSLGVSVWDPDILGKDKQPSPEAKPFLDAASGKELPVLVLQWPGGGLSVKSCGNMTIDELRKIVGKIE